MSLAARRVLAALAAGLVFYAISDILLWQRIFESHDLYQFDSQYQTGHLATLTGMIAVGVVLLWDARWWALWFAAAFYSLNFSGLEDILYYWFQGKSIPSLCPWLDQNPLILFHPAGGWTLLASALIWVTFWVSTLFAPRLLVRVRSFVPQFPLF